MMHIKASVLAIPALIILTSCGGSEEFEDTFTFTESDVEEISALLDRIEGEEGVLPEGEEGESLVIPGVEEIEIDAADAHRFDNLRSELGALEENTYRVTNVFLNVRSTPSIHADLVEELRQGDYVRVLSFPDAKWAEVQLSDARKGFVSTAYISQVISENQLEEVKKRYEGQYEVNFRFLNVRSEPSTQGLKLGELNAHEIVKPIAFHDDWARVPFGDGEGFVAADYLKPYFPKLIVRQEKFALPILRYRGDDPEVADVLVRQVAFLKSQGKKVMTLRDFYNLLMKQEREDANLPEGRVLLLISDVTKETVKDIADALRASSVTATFFFQTDQIGQGGISPQIVKSIASNGNDVQSASFSGDDLRAMTNTNILKELAQSRQILEDITGQDVFAVAYPRGGVNDRVAEQAVQTGYLFGVTLTPAVGESFERAQFLKLPSNSITSSTTEGTLKSLVGIK